MDIKHHRSISRREFLKLTSLSAAGFVLACATNPVTGRRQLMLVSEEKEISIDRNYAPHQFSTDYGTLQDKSLNAYITETGNRIAGNTHRLQVPYNINGVNAVYVNAYAFPGGSIGVTRGIMLELNNEAEMAALLGHELGHVNARHTASIMSKKMLASAVVGGVAAYVGVSNESLGAGLLAAQLGMLTSGVLLASYSRSNERQADALGMEYMVKSGYSPEGMVGLMKMLNGMSKHPSGVTQLLFATHPMSDERYQTAVAATESEYRADRGKPVHRERYMDHTARLRAMKGAIVEMQKGEALMGQKKYDQAESHYQKALAHTPEDYAALVMMSKCMLAQEKTDEADRYAGLAKTAYPDEAQALYISGFVKLQKKQFQTAYNDFEAYDRRLSGNAYTSFFKGLALEGMDQKESAAREYYGFLQKVDRGDQARYAYGRLQQWGYTR